MQNYNIYSIICNYKKVWHIKPDHLVSLYILLEKHEKMRYLCNNLTDLHNI